MCTAVSFLNGDHYFGRTLDYEFSYGEQVVLMPRNFPLPFRHMKPLNSHYGVLGMAFVQEGYPLLYDGVNEKGLAMAGLNFVGNAVYHKPVSGKENVAQFELIAWILSTCANLNEACEKLRSCNITDTAFSTQLPPGQLHWMVADDTGAVVVESTADGLHFYHNPAGVLTNNPPFPQQMQNLADFMHLSPLPQENRFSDKLSLKPYSRGMGAMGLPGDLSSKSRFVRAAFVRCNSLSEKTESASVNQFFHILGSVAQQRGCCRLEDGQCEITIYTSCCNTSKGIYYYTTYENSAITAVDMHRYDLTGDRLHSWPLRLVGQFAYESGEIGS